MLELDWWVYILIAVGLFCAVLFINYVVKKMNETRLDDRLVRLQEKASVSTYSQVQRQPLEMPSRIYLESIIEQSNPPTVTNTQTAEKRESKDQIQIMNFPVSKIVDPPYTSTANESKLNPTPEPQPVFLGAIYDKSTNVKSKSYLNADKDSNLGDIVDTAVSKDNESKTTPGVKALMDVQNEENLKTKEINVLVKKNSDHDTDEADDKVAPTASTSQ